MAICIDGNFVCLGGGCFCQTPTGVEFSGEAVANAFSDERPSPVQGTLCGYAAGRLAPSLPGPGRATVIDKYPFNSDSPASDVGELATGKYHGAAQSSSTSGYTAGGNDPSGNGLNDIEKFPFASDTPASCIGALSQQRFAGIGGQSSLTDGYASGGSFFPPSPVVYATLIDKFPFASDTNATCIADLVVGRRSESSQSSVQNGYHSGGCCADGNPGINNIDKFPFAVDSPASDVGDLLQARKASTAQSSKTHGYTSGGEDGAVRDTIDKFPFSADTPASNAGELSCGIYNAGGTSSTVSGYTVGGFDASANGPTGGSNVSNNMERFPFASESSAVDTGELTLGGRINSTGQQV